MNVLNPPKFVTRSLIGAIGLSAIAFFGVAESASALTVVSGSDYWQTQEGSFFDFGGPIGEVEFIGNPLSKWTPPDSSDPIRVGTADTIVRRYDDVTFDTNVQDGESGISSVELVALSLISKNSIDLLGDGSLFNILVGLNPNKASTGTITINEDNTFSSNFTVSFLPTFQSVDGTVALSCTDVLTAAECNGDQFSIVLSANGEWSKQYQRGLKVEGLVGDINANVHTDLDSTQSDFFPVGIIEHTHENYANPAHIVSEAVPEPLTILGSATALGFGTFFKRKLGKKGRQDKA